MPLYPHEDWGDIQKHIYAKGIITSVDAENDLADVTIAGCQDGSGVPLFYHCDSDAEERSNGAIEGASAAFAVDDEVIVMLEVNGSPVRIVGLVDGIKTCCSFNFFIEGEDEGELTEGVIFNIYDENQVSKPVKDLKYDEDQGNWTFSLDLSQEDVECKGPFWAKYFKAGFKPTQYISIDADKGDFWQEANRVILGDGTLYSDLMDLLEGETGYWEDWSEWPCGKNIWNQISVWADESNAYLGGAAEGGACVPFATVTVGPCSATINIDNEIATIFCSGSYSGGQYSGESSGGIQINKELSQWDGDLPIMSSRRIICNIASWATSSSGIAYSDAIIRLVGYRPGTDQCSILNLYIQYNNNLFGENKQGADCDNGGLNIWVGDDIQQGEDFEFDIKEAIEERGLEGSFDLNRPLNGILIGVSGKGRKPEGSYSSYMAIDYIDFLKWEPWDDSDEPDLCKNNTPWAVYYHKPYGAYYTSCPALPFTYSNNEPDHNSVFTYSIDIVDGVLSYTGDEYDLGTAMEGQFRWTPQIGNREEDYVPGITKVVIKLSAMVTADDRVGLYFAISNDENQMMAFCIAGTPYHEDVPYIGDNNGEEQTIDLESYYDVFQNTTFGEDHKIKRIGFWWRSLDKDEYEGIPATATFNLTCDYIDLA